MTSQVSTPSGASGTSGTSGVADARMWSRLLALHAHVESRLGAALQRRHGLGLSEYRALGFLTDAPDGELRMQDLAARLGLNQSSVTRLVGRLHAADLAFRDLCPDDKRGVYAVIKDSGHTRHQEARATYEETLTAALDEAAGETPEVGIALAALRQSFK
ncbi:MarR family winged helix-turn-helix transcriptional regulator [Streptomyces griseocarneus]|uniref:MarR family winged helix-turn-helix transcriptional regulator n=1 Tax=Streptomyces griseocarneus TaxID=51201 RepID=UPI00167CD0FC|nr:MarR family transcriptional regulator [Streptomyces griseocarneus]MBZ6473958.1 MarR family transcriptional regulator [Streptomyces griseocarneus]GHG66111.1 MarR family transcriptional regulator [Streptomyces griseocarneus]